MPISPQSQNGFSSLNGVGEHFIRVLIFFFLLFVLSGRSYCGFYSGLSPYSALRRKKFWMECDVWLCECLCDYKKYGAEDRTDCDACPVLNWGWSCDNGGRARGWMFFFFFFWKFEFYERLAVWMVGLILSTLGDVCWLDVMWVQLAFFSPYAERFSIK